MDLYLQSESQFTHNMHEGSTCTPTIVKPNTLLYKDGCLRILGWQWHKINMTTIPGIFFLVFCKLGQPVGEPCFAH